MPLGSPLCEANVPAYMMYVEARDQHWLSLGGSPYCEAVSPTEHGPC